MKNNGDLHPLLAAFCFIYDFNTVNSYHSKFKRIYSEKSSSHLCPQSLNSSLQGQSNSCICFQRCFVHKQVNFIYKIYIYANIYTYKYVCMNILIHFFFTQMITYCLHCSRHLAFSNSVLLKSDLGASLVAQWLRICLPMQGTRVRALVWEDPTYRGATRPVSHNY